MSMQQEMFPQWLPCLQIKLLPVKVADEKGLPVQDEPLRQNFAGVVLFLS